MRTIYSLSGIFLFCCFSVVFAEDNFSRLEKDFLLDPPGVGQDLDEVKIYSRISKKTTQKALRSKFDKIHTMLPVDLAKDNESGEFNRYLKFDKDGIKVYLFSHKSSKLGTFKAISHIKASLDSILAVMFDNPSCTEWIHSCGQSYILENISFSERYHYQTFHIPFPFTDRDFVFHSILTQNPRSKTVNITMIGVPDYCNDKQSIECDRVNKSELVRVRKSIGSYLLESDDQGTKITWIQYTDPAGNIPKWLVNQFAADTPYWTLKNLADMVKQEKYKFARLRYNNQGMAIALNLPKRNVLLQKKSPQNAPLQKSTMIFAAKK